MYNLGCMFVESRAFVILDGLPGLYGLKYDSATACGLLLYLCSYKLDSSAIAIAPPRGVAVASPKWQACMTRVGSRRSTFHTRRIFNKGR